MLGDQRFVEYLTQSGYHPRSSKHGDEMSRLLAQDLMAICPIIKNLAEDGSMVFELDRPPDPDVPLGWNIDLVLGPPKKISMGFLSGAGGIAYGPTSKIQIAVDAKCIMTEHGKARRNRQRDLNSLATILHRESPATVVGGLVAINMAPQFRSPLRNGEITVHKNIERIVAETVSLFEDLLTAHSNSQGASARIDAVGVIVVEYSNIPGEQARLVNTPPAPQAESPVYYQTFVKRLCEQFVRNREMKLVEV